jgi:dipeptidyl aminopeptidase/acylaminoacyl peptidase
MISNSRAQKAVVARLATLFVGLGLLIACDDTAGPENDSDEGVDLSLLFAAPTTAEMSAVVADWAERDILAEEVVELARAELPYGSQGLRVRVVSHRVDGIEHVGAIATPVGADSASLPVLVYSHGGDQGVSLDLTALVLPLLFQEELDHFAFVIPSFRSESLVFDGVEYPSGGEPSPWDRDVDDALSLLDVALATTPEADENHIGVLGFSRGADVALLMALRDTRIGVVVEFFGPTDFFGPFAREVVEDALQGTVRDLPGVPFLNQAFIQPLNRGEIPLADVRLELLRRSPVYFAHLLPDLQVHHGSADDVVPAGESERLAEVMHRLGRAEPGFEVFIYEGGVHDPLSLPGSLPRARTFLSRVLLGTQPSGR